MKKRVYSFNGIRYVQRPLTYPRFKKLRELTRGRSLELTPTGVGTWVDAVLEDGLLPAVGRTVLAPYEPTPLHRWWNNFHRRRLGIDPDTDEFEQLLSLSPVVAQVVADFFVLNVSWFESWLNTPLSWGWISHGRKTPGQIASALMRSFGTLQEVTSVPLNGSESKTPSQ